MNKVNLSFEVEEKPVSPAEIHRRLAKCKNAFVSVTNGFAGVTNGFVSVTNGFAGVTNAFAREKMDLQKKNKKFKQNT